MKTISLRELHNKTGLWVRRVREEEEIIVTDRGEAIATLIPIKLRPAKKYSWAKRTLLPGYVAAMKAGKLRSKGDSSIGISEDRSSRDASIAGIEE